MLTGGEIDLASLLEASQRSPHMFAEAIAAAVHALDPTAQVIVAISDQDGKVYRLKGSTGLKHPPIEIPREVSSEDRSEHGSFYRFGIPPSLAALMDVGLDRHLAVYVGLDAPELERLDFQPSHAPVLIIAVAMRDDDDRNRLAQILSTNVPALGRLYSAALDQTKLRIRQLLVKEANRSKDLGSLLQKASRLAHSELDIDRVIALAPDEFGMVLNVRAMYPRPGGLDLSTHTLPMHVDTPCGPVCAAFTNRTISIVLPDELEAPIAPLVPGDCTEALILPLVPTDTLSGEGSVGILVCLGKAWTLDSISQRGTFVWEDVTLLEFFGDMLSVLTRMLRSRDDAVFRVERVLHGAKTIFSSIHNNLALLEEEGVSNTVPPEMQYLLTDAIALLEDITSQLERKRLSSLQQLDTSDEVKIYSDVLAPVAKFAVSLARALGRNDLHVSSLSAAGFRQSPIVKSNLNAVATVFRNLVHNAVKYSQRGREHQPWLDFSWREENGMLVVAVSDDGIGIDHGERELVFVEGYRGQAAMNIDPTGIGVGLADCRSIMSLLGGTIRVVDPISTSFGRASTTIEVGLKVSPEPVLR